MLNEMLGFLVGKGMCRVGKTAYARAMAVGRKKAAPKNRGCESHEKIMQQP